jgi:ubiquitin C-terminal hydrolase
LKKFVNYFKYKIKEDLIKKFENSRRTYLTTSFKYLIENIWQTNGNKFIQRSYNNKNSNNNYFIPKKFKETISKMNPLFEGVQANDAKDLVNYLIMTLHEELNRAPKKKDLNESNLNNDQSNKDLVLSTFIQGFMNENISLISDLFYAMNDSVTECLNCHNRKYNFQIYFFLIFPLEEVRKYKMQNLYNSTNQNMMYLNPMNQMPLQQNFIFVLIPCGFALHLKHF